MNKILTKISHEEFEERSLLFYIEIGKRFHGFGDALSEWSLSL
jgi:hypothetical protein